MTCLSLTGGESVVTHKERKGGKKCEGRRQSNRDQRNQTSRRQQRHHHLQSFSFLRLPRLILSPLTTTYAPSKGEVSPLECVCEIIKFPGTKIETRPWTREVWDGEEKLTCSEVFRIYIYIKASLSCVRFKAGQVSACRHIEHLSLHCENQLRQRYTCICVCMYLSSSELCYLEYDREMRAQCARVGVLGLRVGFTPPSIHSWLPHSQPQR